MKSILAFALLFSSHLLACEPESVTYDKSSGVYNAAGGQGGAGANLELLNFTMGYTYCGSSFAAAKTYDVSFGSGAGPEVYRRSYDIPGYRVVSLEPDGSSRPRVAFAKKQGAAYAVEFVISFVAGGERESRVEFCRGLVTAEGSCSGRTAVISQRDLLSGYFDAVMDPARNKTPEKPLLELLRAVNSLR